MTKQLRIILVSVFLVIPEILIFAQPTGIYVLDSNQGTYRDANIRDYSFVSGFVWRTSWTDMETSQGVYNFAGIDHIVQKLDLINKKLTVLFGAYSVEPSYIASQIGVTTYNFTDPLSNVTTKRAVPYDGYLLQRFRVFLSALANHQIYSKSSGTMVALKNHPVLANIATNIPGLGAIRNVNGLNKSVESTLTNYNRNKFVDSLIESMKIQTENFPTKNVFIPYYKNINDNTTSLSLYSYIRTQLLLNFDNIQNPKISFWQENLAGFRDTATNVFTGLPTTDFATPLNDLNGSAYTMFQMLQGWTTPFLDPAKTANSTPFDAMCYAKNTFDASYYEIYVSDIDNALYQSSFNTWNPVSTCDLIMSDNNQSEDNPKLNVTQNLVLNSITVNGLNKQSDFLISIFNMCGQNMLSIQNKSILDITNLATGMYIITINQDKSKYSFKFIKK